MELRLTSQIPPSVNHYLAYRAILKNKRPMAMSYKTPEAVRYKKQFTEYVIEEVKKQKWTLTPNKTQHFYIDTVFYFPATNLDANNYFKVTLDAITDTQLIWLDDNVACERVQAVYYDSVNPRMEMVIRPVDYIGVFKDASQLEKFTSNCMGCARHARNCSIIRQAKEGRVQEDIKDNICTKYKPKKSLKGEKI